VVSDPFFSDQTLKIGSSFQNNLLRQFAKARVGVTPLKKGANPAYVPAAPFFNAVGSSALQGN
jgi:hypothetical protein